MDLTLLISGVLVLGCLIALSWFAGSGAPYVPTRYPKLRKLLKNAGVKKGKYFYELGSGDGRVVIEAAKLGAESFGIEQSWIRVWYSRWVAKRNNLKNAFFYHGDIFHRHFYNGDFIFIYLLPETVSRLEEKLKRELKKNACIITQTYHFRNLEPIKKVDDFWIYKI